MDGWTMPALPYMAFARPGLIRERCCMFVLLLLLRACFATFCRPHYLAPCT